MTELTFESSFLAIPALELILQAESAADALSIMGGRIQRVLPLHRNLHLLLSTLGSISPSLDSRLQLFIFNV